jgi:amidase
VATRSPLGTPVEPEIARAVERVAQTLSALGHLVEPAELPTATIEEFLPLWELQILQVPTVRESLLQPVTRWLRSRGRAHSLARILEQKRALAARILGAFERFDLMLTPVVGVYPPRVGATRGLSPEEAFRSVAHLGEFTALFNVSGQPAAAIPAGVSKEGLPFAVQLAGRQGRDDDVLAVAKQIETALPWSERKSPLFR